MRYHPEVPFVFSGSLPIPKAAPHSFWILVLISQFGGDPLGVFSFLVAVLLP